VQGRNKIF